MKKSKLLIVALIGMMLAGGLALASCRAGCEGNGNCEVKDSKGSLCSDSSCDVYKHGGNSGKCDC